MDLALWAHNHALPADELAAALGMTDEHAHIVYADIEDKRRTTHYLHARPLLVEPVSGSRRLIVTGAVGTAAGGVRAP